MSKKRFHPLKWVIWTLACLFYFYEYFIRVFPSVMVHELMEAFTINATALGTLSAFYLYAYAPMQIPVGALMDRYGARRLLTLGSMICGVGGIVFSYSHHIGIADFARLLMGIGSAFGFIGLVYICSHWFSGKILALLIGIGNSIGMLGAVCGQGPLSMAVKIFDWRATIFFLGLIGILLGFVIFFVVRGETLTHKKEKKAPILENFKSVCKNGQTWINAIISFSFYLTTSAFAALWAVPFLQSAHGLDVTAAGFAASMIFVGWIIGGPLIGYFSDKMANRKLFLSAFSLLTFLGLLPVIYLEHLGAVTIFTLMFFIGVFASGQLLTYTLSVELNQEKAKGTAIALTNFLVFLVSSFTQTFVGYLLDLHRLGADVVGIPMYSPHNYRFALTFFPASCAIAFIFTLFLKEKKHISHKKLL